MATRILRKNYNEDMDFIKKFSKITIKKACDSAGVNSSNLHNGITTDENIKKVKNEIEKMIKELIGVI